MRKTNKNRVIKILLTALMMASLVACGNKETMAPVAEETTTEVPVTEEPQEVNSDATYVEIKELEYEEDTKVLINGTLYDGENSENLDVIDIDWELTNITIDDTEEGKTVTIEQSVYGYIWKDGDIFKTNLNVPVARLADAYTGKMITANEDIGIEWKDNTYTINATETTAWEDGDWNTDWVEDPKGGERLSSTLRVKTVVIISADYDGLSLVLVPITDASGNVNGEYIMDVWTDGSYLFNVNDMSSNFTVEVEEVEETETDESVESTEETKPSESTATTAPKEEKPAAHVHDYKSTITTQSSCVVPGIRTYTCDCGDSYTENLGTTDHNFVASTTIIHHDEVWQSIPRQIPGQRVVICGCGAEFTDSESWNNHRIASIESNGPHCLCGGPYDIEDRPGETVYDYVKTSDAWDETITTYICSVCGQQRK